MENNFEKENEQIIAPNDAVEQQAEPAIEAVAEAPSKNFPWWIIAVAAVVVIAFVVLFAFRSPKYADYTNSSYSRAHMCPAADNKWDSQAYKESCYMTNMCPQKQVLNGGKWKNLEERCRNTWAKDYGKIYIVCGPIMPRTNKKYIGETKILIPEKFFKAILREVNVNGKIHYEAIGYILTQKNQLYMNKCFYTVNEIEAMTGLDLFHNLDDRVEEKVEEVVHEDTWQNPYI